MLNMWNPVKKLFSNFQARKCLGNTGEVPKVLLTTKDIPDLHFNVNGESEFPEHSENSLDPAGEVIEVMETNVYPQNVHKLFIG